MARQHRCFSAESPFSAETKAWWLVTKAIVLRRILSILHFAAPRPRGAMACSYSAMGLLRHGIRQGLADIPAQLLLHTGNSALSHRVRVLPRSLDYVLPASRLLCHNSQQTTTVDVASDVEDSSKPDSSALHSENGASKQEQGQEKEKRNKGKPQQQQQKQGKGNQGKKKGGEAAEDAPGGFSSREAVKKQRIAKVSAFSTCG